MKIPKNIPRECLVVDDNVSFDALEKFLEPTPDESVRGALVKDQNGKEYIVLFRRSYQGNFIENLVDRFWDWFDRDAQITLAKQGAANVLAREFHRDDVDSIVAGIKDGKVGMLLKEKGLLFAKVAWRNTQENQSADSNVLAKLVALGKEVLSFDRQSSVQHHAASRQWLVDPGLEQDLLGAGFSRIDILNLNEYGTRLGLKKQDASDFHGDMVVGVMRFAAMWRKKYPNDVDAQDAARFTIDALVLGLEQRIAPVSLEQAGRVIQVYREKKLRELLWHALNSRQFPETKDERQALEAASIGKGWRNREASRYVPENSPLKAYLLSMKVLLQADRLTSENQPPWSAPMDALLQAHGDGWFDYVKVLGVLLKPEEVPQLVNSIKLENIRYADVLAFADQWLNLAVQYPEMEKSLPTVGRLISTLASQIMDRGSTDERG